MGARWRGTFATLACASPTEEAAILAALVAGEFGPEVRTLQVAAWQEQLAILKAAAVETIEFDPAAAEWAILLEYTLPRRRRRPDVVILAGGTVVVLEFKTGGATGAAEGVLQLHNYCLDLRDFHKESAGRPIVPLLVTAADVPMRTGTRALIVPPDALGQRLREAVAGSDAGAWRPIDATGWEQSAYQPTPSIVEAATQLYETHDVREISHSSAQNLTLTTEALLRATARAQAEGLRTICFVTGVPGAGKTLAGLNAVHDRRARNGDRPLGVFLSGNGPLVKVIQQALSRSTRGSTATEAMRHVEAFIQNVHVFLDEYRQKGSPPENVVVFDEAQRAWDAEKVKKANRRRARLGRGKFGDSVIASEPDQLLEIMERPDMWSVVICLVGGGQEIHDGEAGLEAWGEALGRRSVPWHVLASPEVMGGGTSVAGHKLFPLGLPENVEFHAEPALHLRISTRSPRAQRLAEWVNAVLRNEPGIAAGLLPDPTEFPIFKTRDLEAAKSWLRAQAAVDERRGLVASSGSDRHRAYGIEMSSAFHQSLRMEHWFLHPRDDIRSSDVLEVAATEFECQGLELDWVGLCWAGDLVPSSTGAAWMYRDFKGSKWHQIRSERAQRYLVNKYRVLLTRARRGMIIWVPPGSLEDQTIPKAEFDEIYAYLSHCGIPDVPY